MPGDPRIEEYAKLLVERCVDVQPGWQVVVGSHPLGRPLVDEVCRHIAKRGAYALLRLGYGMSGGSDAWIKEAPEELLQKVPSVDAYTFENIDCNIFIMAPENTRDGADIPAERMQLLQAARQPYVEPFMSHKKAWVGCQWPTPALAQDAGMTLEQFTEFLYGAVLIDWDALEKDMQKIADCFDAETELTFSLAGRKGLVSGIGPNMPSGEVFYAPVEDSANGVVTFSEYPAYYHGRDVNGARLRFENGVAVEITADGNEEFLREMLSTDEGASRLGEFGIGCNPGIQQHMRNTLFDEKIEGTIHLAMGMAYPVVGGTNESAIHWDMVKDLRRGGEIYLDGELVQENGVWES
jgi:aminopeptidase